MARPKKAKSKQQAKTKAWAIKGTNGRFFRFAAGELAVGLKRSSIEGICWGDEKIVRVEVREI
jgi:hypothetical protein